ncbi:MAG: Manganese transport system membrane protein MntC [Chlamydiia bacterium]|nr:Manganese transport system membrane protein MntC [Chlamydiia bacterium]
MWAGMKDFFLDLLLMLKDPTYSTSLLGSMLACVSLSWIGVIYSLRKSSLVGEVIAHSAFPGLILGGFVGILFGANEMSFSLLFIIGAVITAYIAMRQLITLQRKWKKSADSSLMISISAFLGVGVLLASIMQTINPIVYKDVTIFLYGRTATMLQFHVYLYAFVMLCMLGFVVTCHRRMKILEFDKTFAKFLGIGSALDGLILFMTLVVVIISLRSLGILLLSGMMTTPAIAARWWVKKVSSIFILASVLGLISAFLGGYFSLYIGAGGVVLPTGPMITVVSASITIFSILFGIRGGIVLRSIRRLLFSLRCQEENLLKALYKREGKASIKEMKDFLHLSVLKVIIVLVRSRKNISLLSLFEIELTKRGSKRAQRIIRLHRLWEVYLYEVGFTKNRVHVFAEEIEHVLTPEMEKFLMKRLGNPTHCPHKQEIPKFQRNYESI